MAHRSKLGIYYTILMRASNNELVGITDYRLAALTGIKGFQGRRYLEELNDLGLITISHDYAERWKRSIVITYAGKMVFAKLDNIKEDLKKSGLPSF